MSQLIQIYRGQLCHNILMPRRLLILTELPEKPESGWVLTYELWPDSTEIALDRAFPNFYEGNQMVK